MRRRNAAATEGPPQCAKCGAIIRFVRMESGKSMPVDPIQDSGGNVCATPTADGRSFVAGFVITQARPALPHTVRFMAHWATCGGRTPVSSPARVPEPTLF